MISKKSRILILAPHTDDAEFGCGGSIAKFAKNGNEIFSIAFSAAEDSVPAEFDRDINRKNMYEAMDILGVPKKNVEILAYKVREFPEYRQKILDDIIGFSKIIKPDIVFLPSKNDTHQDHQVICNEGFRAFKKITILGYEIPWNNLSFTTNSFIMLNENEVNLKIESLKKYIAQLSRNYVNEEFIKSIMRTRGGQMGARYAEAFEVVRWII